MKRQRIRHRSLFSTHLRPSKRKVSGTTSVDPGTTSGISGKTLEKSSISGVLMDAISYNRRFCTENQENKSSANKKHSIRTVLWGREYLEIKLLCRIRETGSQNNAAIRHPSWRQTPSQDPAKKSEKPPHLQGTAALIIPSSNLIPQTAPHVSPHPRAGFCTRRCPGRSTHICCCPCRAPSCS